MSLRWRSPYWNLWPSPTLLRKKLGVRLLPCLTFPIIGIYILHNILHLMTWAQKQRRSTTKVTKNFVQCLHLARRFIVSPPWQFLAPPDLPLQQGSDQLNCNSKHLLMLYEYVIKLHCVYINEQRESIFWCNLRFDRSRCDPICDAVLSRGPPPVIRYSTTICKLVDLIPALHQSDCRIPNWVSAKTVLRNCRGL